MGQVTLAFTYYHRGLIMKFFKLRKAKHRKHQNVHEVSNELSDKLFDIMEKSLLRDERIKDTDLATMTSMTSAMLASKVVNKITTYMKMYNQDPKPYVDLFLDIMDKSVKEAMEEALAVFEEPKEKESSQKSRI